MSLSQISSSPTPSRAGARPCALMAAALTSALLAGCASTPLPPWPDRNASRPPPPVRQIPPPSRQEQAPAPMARPGVVLPAPVPRTADGATTAPVVRPSLAPLTGTLPDLPYRPEVAARFPDPPILYHTPGLHPDRRAFTTNAEIGQWLHALAQQTTPPTTRATVLQLGPSQRGAPIHALVLTQERDEQPQALAESKRPTVLLIGQQHGDAPASSEALLVVAQELAQGLLAPLLERINVIIVPRANPDGAEAGTAATADGTDLQRDHLLLHSPEARALNQLVRDYRPMVVLDSGEFPAAGAVLTQFGGLNRHDAHLSYATTGNVHEFVTKAAREWMQQPLEQALQGLGLAVEWAHSPSAVPGERRMVMDSVQPDSGRNLWGLKHAVSLRVASRGVGLGRTHIQRRVHTQVNAMAAALRMASERAARLEQVRSFVIRDTVALACRNKVVVQAAHTTESRELTLLNPDTGADMPTTVEWDSALRLSPTLERARPCGYWVAPTAQPAIERLRLHGLQVLRVAEAGAVLAEAPQSPGTTAASPLARTAIDVPAGSYYVPLNQPMANVAIAALEADTPFGFASRRLVGLPEEVLRVMVTPSLVFEDME